MRLIDADKFEAFGSKIEDAEMGYTSGYVDGVTSVLEAIDAAPTIDAVPVVRCRECKWGRTVRECDEYVWCGKPYAPRWASHKADWYCADGKRKEDAT